MSEPEPMPESKFWITKVVQRRRTYLLTFTAIMWALAMLGAVLWLGRGYGVSDTVEWLVIAGILLVCSFLWALLMWHLFVGPRLARSIFARQERDREQRRTPAR